MVVVGVYCFAASAIKLQDGVVRHPGEEFMRLRGVEFNYVRDLAVAEVLHCLARFGVPKQNLSIVARRQETNSIR